jgi:hypothetical protein
MASMISLETDELEDVVEEKAPEVVRLTQNGMTVDLTGDTTESQHASRPLDDRFVVSPGNTIYQRRGGGLRRRLEDHDVVETDTGKEGSHH